MSTFETPEWENNPVGDAACENLFKNTVWKKYNKKKNKKNKTKNLFKNDETTFKQKHKTQKSNHDQFRTNIPKLLNDSVARSTVNVVTNKKDFDVKTKSKKNKKKENRTSSPGTTASEQTKVQFSEEPSKTDPQIEKSGNFEKSKKLKSQNLHHTHTGLSPSNSMSASSGGISAKSNKKFEHTDKKRNTVKQKLENQERKQRIGLEKAKLPVIQSQQNQKSVNDTNQRSKGKLTKSKNGSLNQEYDIGPISTKSEGEPSFLRNSTSENKQVRKLTYNEKKKQKITAMLQKTLTNPDRPSTEKVKNSSLPLKERMMKRLKAARFRYLNEQIYSTDGKEAQQFFTKDPNAFKAYHDGYRQQVSLWPINPVDVIIDSVKKMPQSHVIADFGCGEAKLAKSVQQKVHSFDLVASNDSVTACDMAHVPLRASSVDVVVFCLSLMGTNLSDYLAEANRVLKVGGTLKIAEVTSRFTDVKIFIDGLKRYNFDNISQDLSNDLFYFLDFRKESNIKNKKKLPTIGLLPCLYKKR